MHALKLFVLLSVFAFSHPAEACFGGTIGQPNQLATPDPGPSEAFVPLAMPVLIRLNHELYSTADWVRPINGGDFVLVLDGVVVPACYHYPVIMVMPEPARIGPAEPSSRFLWRLLLGWVTGIGVVLVFIWVYGGRRGGRSTSG